MNIISWPYEHKKNFEHTPIFSAMVDSLPTSRFNNDCRGIVAQYTVYVTLKCSLHIKITRKIPFLKMNTVLCGTVKKILEQQTTKLPLNFSQNRIFECND